MSHNRLVQIIALLISGACIAASAMLNQELVRQRKELVVTDTRAMDASERMPPAVAMVTAVFGPLRPLIVNILWYRASELQMQGQYFEANTQSQWITQLQPRFGKVWEFHAWNMAYNISVMTHTPEERWDWVRKGVYLLRDQGIPLNPNSVHLYKELSWFYFHKIAKNADDMHWFYKKQLIAENHEIFGELPINSTTKQAVEHYQEIARAPKKVADLLAATPAVKPLLDEAMALGYEPDERLLRAISRAQSYADAYVLKLRKPQPGELAWYDVKLDESLKRHPAAVKPLINFLRRQTIEQNMHMDVDFMVQLMERNGPMDWRHPLTHGIYWSARGYIIGGGINTQRNLDLINIMRNDLYNLQELAFQGGVTFDPVLNKLQRSYVPTLYPEPAMIRAFDEAMSKQREEMEAAVNKGKYNASVLKNFRGGHENFLQRAVSDHYLYGNREEASRYLDKLRKEFTGKGASQDYVKMYMQSLDNYVMSSLQLDLGNSDANVMQFLYAMSARAIQQGLAQNRMDLHENFMRIARELYDQYQKDLDINPNAVQQRRALVPLKQIYLDTMVRYFADGRVPMMWKTQAWRNTPDNLRVEVYDRVKPQMVKQAEAENFDVERAFAEPPGMEAHRKKLASEQSKLPEGAAPPPIAPPAP